jgi:LPXTG-motif cell wall-anchored protein
MDWKLLLIGLAMLVAGGFLAWRFRKSKFASETGPGCAMAVALLLMLTGVMALIVGVAVRVGP